MKRRARLPRPALISKLRTVLICCYLILQAFGISAHPAHVASALVLQCGAALRACLAQYLLLAVLFEYELLAPACLVVHVLFQRYSYGVRAREHDAALLP